jgi:DNA-binding transcriptional LysR family regulator
MSLLMPNVGLADLDLFFRAAKLKSLRECARQLDMTPGSVSKSIKRLEKKVGKSLLRRSVSGILLTAEGNELMEIAEKILRLTAQMAPAQSKKQMSQKVWGIGSLSFISSRLIPTLLEPVCESRSRTRFRLVEFGNNQLVAHGLNGAFEMAVHIGILEWTRVWSSYEIGTMRWALYGRNDHPLTQMKTVTSADVVRFPFVMPTGWSSQGFIRGEDHCPIPWGMRFAGHEATTGETALEIVMESSHLVFVPVLLAQRLVDHGLIAEINVSDWPIVEKKIFLSVRDDLVPSSLLQMVVKLIKKNLR